MKMTLPTWIGFALLVGALNGCVTGGVAMNPALLQPCADPILLEGKTGKDLTENYVKNAELWKECRADKAALNKAVKGTKQ